MRTMLVVAASELFDQPLGLGAVCKPLGIQALVAQPTVEPLAQAIPTRLARPPKVVRSQANPVVCSLFDCSYRTAKNSLKSPPEMSS